MTNPNPGGHMATKTDDMTVTIKGDGFDTGAIPVNEMEKHSEEIGQAVFGRRQLSFDVGGKTPDRSSVKASIDLLIPRQLRKGSAVSLQVIAADGELLASTDAKVIAVTFEDEYKDGYIVGTERVHKVKAV